MLKKFLLATAILSQTASVAFAAAPYVGAGLGIVTNTSSDVATSQGSQSGNFRGVPLNLFAGYGGVISQSIYLAGELGATIATAQLSNNHGMKTSYSYGASILPGFMLSDHTMAFARAGVVRTRFSDAGESKTGGEIGVGLQTSVTQNIDLRGEYDYTGFGSFNNSYGRISSPNSDAFNAALVYKFD